MCVWGGGGGGGGDIYAYRIISSLNVRWIKTVYSQNIECACVHDKCACPVHSLPGWERGGLFPCC